MADSSINLEHMPQSEFIRRFGGTGPNAFTMEVLLADIEAGAPVNMDGTINVWDYCAWVELEGYNRAIK